ncbi:Methyltransferase domain-containing protein [Pseudomonas pohangensis]|uniref:Methyltransferase domain-containing protein n=1 Tax=Pseudomonas pohangensis TaxID=364197 RepID=A0A1H2EEZ5_9PSED|nr:WcbI family polysaccharide biosynthesis putative acetyltransferase [Pseudomonas pohangensis]SDT93722.1 Methyltransferase domain-containing protein [Pseudomonas pohangensis]
MHIYGSSEPDAELIILYGNCQTTFLASQLAATDSSPNGRTYACVLNHQIPGQMRVLPTAEQLGRCILYLEQYDSEEHLPVRDMLRQAIPMDCPRLIFPTFMMFCLWPFDCVETRMQQEPDFVWGRYPYGDAIGLEVAASGLQSERATRVYMQLSTERMPDLQQRLQCDIERIRRHDKACDVIIGDYVLDNFRRKHVFWTTGHVSSEAIGVLGKRLYQAALPILGGELSAGLARIEAELATFPGMGSVQVPIHPLVAQALELEYCSPGFRFNWYNNLWSFEEYLPRYLAYDRNWKVGGDCASVSNQTALAASTDIYQADMQLGAARYMCWMPGHVNVTAQEVTIEGWALSVWDQPSNLRFLLNGVDFDEIDWPMTSPDLLVPFGLIPNAGAARFRCKYRIRDGQSPYQNGFIRFNLTSQFGEHRHSYRNAWYIADPHLELPLPSPLLIEQSTGSDNPLHFRLGGATIVKRIEQLLLERFDRPLSSFSAILDWNCGAGRLTRYLAQFNTHVCGADMALENIQSCAQGIQKARFQLTSHNPPSPFANDSFDLVIGLAAMNRFDERLQDAWLAELQRIVIPGGLLLMSVNGRAQKALYRTTTDQLQAEQRHGIVPQGLPCDPEAADIANSLYANVMHSHDYVLSRWGGWFDVLDIIEAIAANQDLVILRRRH